ncbi:hypothetical protein QQZ08_010643 [Neonectria magnoliae]|uniref:Xylanolytic transcriptional activator regulatory domain-containing protein n=1 Tax=Neonectria magnoliae TaxID=2732573 RepID=A0ABR1HFK0_9HYPO
MRRLAYLEDALASKSRDELDPTVRSASESSTRTAAPPPCLPRSPSPTESRASQTNDDASKECIQSPEQEPTGMQKTRGSKRRKFSLAASLGSSTQSSHEDEPCTTWQSPLLRQAQHYLQGELNRSELNMTQERQWLFQSGLALAERVDSPAAPAWMNRIELQDTVDFYAERMYPPLEFLYLTLNGLGNSSVITRFYLHLGSHLSKLTLERMELALIENTVHGHRRLEYIVCVNFWAYLVLTSIESEDPSTAMAQHLGGSRDRYLGNAKRALKRMSILATPTVSTLQALLSGVMLFLDVGDFENCWILNSAACRACVALGGQFLADRASDPTSTQAQEVRASLFNCFIFDKAFSISMDRPCSLPDMEINIASLVLAEKDEAAYDICIVLLEIAQAMDSLVKVRRLQRHGDGKANLERLHATLDSLSSVSEIVDKASRSPLYQSDNFLRGEWMAMEFTYHSVRAALFSIVLASKPDAETLQLRLISARRALRALKSMQDNAWAHFIRSKAFASSLTWTILIFPFSAFFVVFSNVVTTADLGDLRLLKDVADGFSVISNDAPTIQKIESFCQRLVKLCFETITKPRQSSSMASAQPPPSQPNRDKSCNRAVEIPMQNAPNDKDMGKAPTGRQTRAPSATATPQSGLRVDLDSDDFMSNVEGLGMFNDDRANPLPLENNGDQIWKLFEAHFDDLVGTFELGHT